MQCSRLRCHHSSVGASAARQRHHNRPVCCLPQQQQQASTSHSKQQQQQQCQHNRRAALAALILGAAGTAARPAAASASSDLLEGTQHWLSIGQQSFGLWVQKGIDGIVNDDSIGITDLEGTTRKRRFGGWVCACAQQLHQLHQTPACRDRSGVHRCGGFQGDNPCAASLSGL